MNDIPGLVEYLSISRPLILLGAGVSASSGMPVWSALAESLLMKLRVETPSEVEPLEVPFAQQNYPKFFGAAVKPLRGIENLCAYCKRELSESGKSQGIYHLIAGIPARGYLTTNYDSLLHAYFRSKRLTSVELGNSSDDLSRVDFDVPRTIVKLHGTLDDTKHLVLTEQQYDDVLNAPRFESLRSFTVAHLHASRLLFIGYSFRDPDLQSLLQTAAAKLRRKVPLFGILANVSEMEAQELYDRYNLTVLRYKAEKGDHSELAKILGIVVSYFSSRPVKTNSLKFSAAQSLYMWHKLKSPDATDAVSDALQAVVLGTLGDAFGKARKKNLVSSISSIVSESAALPLGSAIDEAIKKLQDKGLIVDDNLGLITMTAQGKNIQRGYSSQFQALRAAFIEQVGYDLEALLPKTGKQFLNKLQDIVNSALMQIFVERGGELADSAFSDRFETRGSLDLLATINSFTSPLPDAPRAVVFSYIMELITKPKEDQRLYLEFLSKAFFAAQVIGIDPDGAMFRKAVLEARTVMLDANIIIPAAALNSAKHSYFRNCIKVLTEAGVRLITIDPFIDEVMVHFRWAEYHVTRYGSQSVEVLESALGTPAFRRNEAIDGFIRSAAASDLSIDEYLSECFGGPPSHESIKALLRGLGVSLFSLNEVPNEDNQVWAVQAEIETYIQELQTAVESPKSPPRIKGEAYAFAVCHHWQRVRPEDVPEELWQCCLLSQGMYLNKVAKNGPYPSQYPVVVRPDALQEAIRAFKPGIQHISISEAMLATYVQSANHFIDKHKYADFFRPLIADSEKVYRDNLGRFQSLVDAGSEDALDEYDALDIPFVVDSLRRTSAFEAERMLAERMRAFAEQQAATAAEVLRVREESTRNAELARLALEQLSTNARRRIEGQIEKKFGKE